MIQKENSVSASPAIADEMTCDLLVVGAGIFGLWVARHSIKAGKRVILCDKRAVGSGASGGFLGALMPHMPDVWNPKKQMQFEALVSLPQVISELEEETGLDCGYRRCGRLMPMVHEKMLDHLTRRIAGAEENWRTPNGDHFFMDHLAPPVDGSVPNNWLSADLAAFGASHDTLSARVNPRAYLKALATYVRREGRLIERQGVATLEPTNGRAVLDDGSVIACGQICVAAGHEAYPILQPWLAPLNADKPIGRGVKGQAVLVEFVHGDDLPIVYHDGAYVVPHAGNRVAIGSTSLNNWEGSADAFDQDDMTFYEKAISVVPALAGAPILERWAAVRPRNTLGKPWDLSSGTEPYVGPVPGVEGLSVAIGSFKIGFGVAHYITR